MGISNEKLSNCQQVLWHLQAVKLTVNGEGLEVLTVVLLKLQAYCCVVGRVIPS